MKQVSMILNNNTGLHARPASLFTNLAKKFKSEIIIKKGDKHADSKRMLQVLSLGVVKGDEITITASGKDEVEAVEALKTLIDSNFGQ